VVNPGRALDAAACRGSHGVPVDLLAALTLEMQPNGAVMLKGRLWDCGSQLACVVVARRPASRQQSEVYAQR